MISLHALMIVVIKIKVIFILFWIYNKNLIYKIIGTCVDLQNAKC